jgi:hypothetical protein
VPKFIAVHDLLVFEKGAAAMKKQAGPMIAKGFTWNHTFCDMTGHKFFCEWDAPSQDALEQAFKQFKMPFETVYPEKKFDIAKGKFVPLE